MAKQFVRIPKLTGFGVLPAELVLKPRIIVIRYATEGGAKFDVLRADDLLVINFDIGSIPKPYIKVTFPPQSFAEQAVQNPPATPPPTVGCYMSGPSQLFFVPKPGWKIAEIPLMALANLLDWNSFGDLQLSNGRLSTAQDGVSPDGTLTYIEAPYGLLLSPLARVQPTLTSLEPQHGLLSIPGAEARETPALPGFTHRAPSIPFAFVQPIPIFENNQSPVEHGGITELWHARGNVDYVAAIFAGRSDLPSPDVIALSYGDRNNVVANSPSADSADSADKIECRVLLLSSLGAWLDVNATWPTAINGLLGWVHRSTLGRDQHVVTVHAGVLFPFGHRASLISVTERPFPENSTDPLYLVQHQYVVVTKPVMEGFDTHRLPFKSVEILTRVTPSVTQDQIPDAPVFVTQDPSLVTPPPPFWPQVNGAADYMFHLRGTDATDAEAYFSMPLIFVDLTLPPQGDLTTPPQVDLSSVAVAYQKSNLDRRTADLGGVPVAYGDAGEGNHTVLNTLSLTFAGVPGKTALPIMASANVRIPAVTHLLGQDLSTDIEFTDASSPTDQQIFAKITEPITFQFGSTDQSGGFIAPTMTLQSLSHQFGPMASDASGQFEASQYASFTLLGNLSLKELIRSVSPSPLPPKIVPNANGGASMVWTTFLNTFGPFQASAAGGVAQLDLKVEKIPSQGSNGPQTNVTGTLSNFTLNLFEIIAIEFSNLTFNHFANQKLAVTAAVNSIRFMNALAFLQTLAQVIPSDGFNNPPALEVTPTGAEISYSLGLPTIYIPTTVGPLAVQNVNLGADCKIPFTGDPLAFGFHFATPEKPFLLTLDALGGGGYFNMSMTAAGVQSLNVALEFGGSLSIDLGVASGAITVMGGFHFGLKMVGSQTTEDVTAFVHASGDVDVLDLISVSVEFYLGLDYNGQHFTGTATLTVEVDVMFFHEAVDLTMSRSY